MLAGPHARYLSMVLTEKRESWDMEGGCPLAHRGKSRRKWAAALPNL
jgi:hypothetical protein